jgi:PAS domain S-box-containing protein
MTFQLKLLLSMMLLVVLVTVTTLVITENQVRVSYERHFQQSFKSQVDFFLQQRAARLEPVEDRVVAAAAAPRLLAAMENAGQADPEQRDVDDLYQNGSDQLAEIFASHPGGRTNSASGLFFFLNPKGEVLYPSSQVKLPFSLSGSHRVAQRMETIGGKITGADAPQVGYLPSEDEPGAVAIREMVYTPIVDRVGHQRLGVLGVGFPLPRATPGAGMLSATWLDGRLYSSSIPADALRDVERQIQAEPPQGEPPARDFAVRVGTAPYQAYCQALETSPAFPPAYQVCLYSLADAAAEKQKFRRRILVSGTLASLCALALSWLISRGLAVPLRELVAGTAEIQRGNYTAKVPVRGQDEIGRLAEAFNGMTLQIEASHAAQEQRIAERTQELAERKRGEEALRQSEASLREAQRIAHLGNWQWNIATDELRWSDEIYSIFGLARPHFGATYEAFLERVHPEDRERVRQAVRQTVEADKPYDLDHRVVRPDGDVRVVHERAEIIRDAGGRPAQMVGTVQDITEQKRIEAEFLRAQRLDSIGALAGGMAHDLNNALSPILMGIQLIRREARDPETQQMLSVMEANTHRGAEMVRQVLTFARGRDGEREVLNAGRLLREMESIARQTLPRSITVQALVPPDLWPVFGNATQLHQVLLNLCINARDAMPKGGTLTLAADNLELDPTEAQAIPNASPGAYVMVLVSDTGTGIPPEILPRIFDAFFTTKGPGKGTGLGLSTIARIVRNHGGFVSVKTEVGAGTSFEIYLPRAERAPALAAAPVRPSPKQALGHGELILFIDDDRSVREMVTPTLLEHGYRVVSAANGPEALALLRRDAKDIRLVMTDLAMPEMDGLELLGILRASHPELPVILMSGTLEPGKDQLPPGARAFLAKPFQLEQLLGAIAGALERTSRTLTGATQHP